MFCGMERNTNSIRIWFAKSNFDINIYTITIFTKHPHISIGKFI